MRLRKYAWIVILLVGFAYFDVTAHNFAPAHAEETCAVYQFSQTPTVAGGSEVSDDVPELPTSQNFEFPENEFPAHPCMLIFTLRGPPA